MQMVAYISISIIDEYDANGLVSAQARYRAWFISTTLYARYKAAVDQILNADGYGACIVTV
jgi:hypothetical protein